MQLKITGTNIELTPAVRQRIQRKLGKLTRHLPSIMETHVEITQEDTKSREQRFLVHATVVMKGNRIHGEERGADLYTAIDRVADVMLRQVAHFKGKLIEKKRGVSLARGLLAEETGIPAPKPDVVKVEQRIVRPMTVDEAIEELERTGQDFLLYLHADTKAVNVVYRRKSGDYAVIQPEFE